MFGRKKADEDVFETEERLQSELETARRQLAETTGKIAAADAEYKRAASDALASGDDTAALKLRREIEKLQVRRDGLEARIADTEPNHQEAARAAGAERLKLAEAARREKLAAAVAEGQAAVRGVVEGFELFMRALSRWDDARAALASQEFGMAEVEKLQIPPFGPGSLRGQLLAAGWRERTGVRPSFLEVTALQAPPKK